MTLAFELDLDSDEITQHAKCLHVKHFGSKGIVWT